jgi:DNA helicase HerA-like ATPase
MFRPINPGEHALIVGQTGSGKSVLLQTLIKNSVVAPIFIMDSKGDDGFLTLNRSDERLEIFDGGIDAFEKYIKRAPRRIPDYVVIRPPIDELDDVEIVDNYLLLIYTYFKGKAIIAIDELYMIHKSGRCGRGLSALLTRGRSQGKSLFGATQRPSWISGFCLSEATHYFVFRLIDINDRKRLSHIGYNKNEMMERYHYYCYDSLTGNGENFKPLPFDNNSTNDYIDKKGWI